VIIIERRRLGRAKGCRRARTAGIPRTEYISIEYHYEERLAHVPPLPPFFLALPPSLSLSLSLLLLLFIFSVSGKSRLSGIE